MKILILGNGQVGSTVAQNLAAIPNNDVTVIDIDEKALQETGSRLDVQTVFGNGASPFTLERAGAEDADLLLALSRSDETNIVACKVAADMGVWMVDMPASGGRRMMEAAAEAVAGYGTKPLLIGVTVLTSMEQSDLAEIGLNIAPEEQVIRLAKLAQSSGLDGVVCSAQEAAPLRRELGQDFVLVTPGIRLDVAGNNDDQRRIMTPAEALAAGSTYLVMGRPVTQAADPVAVLREVNRVANA